MAQVLRATSPHETSRSASPFLDHSPSLHPPSSSSPFLAAPVSLLDTKQSHYYGGFQIGGSSDEDSSTASSPRYDPKSSVSSTPPSSLSLDPQEEEEEEDEEGLCFPTYGDHNSEQLQNETGTPAAHSQQDDSPPTPLSAPIEQPSHSLKPADDTAVYDEPTRQVDYLSHDWQEEDICVSWRHIVSNRKTYGEKSRLENASWRTWTKSKYCLRTVQPERLNWSKDCDVTWLYGPLQEAHTVNRRWSTQSDRNGSRSNEANCQSEPASHLSKNNSFLTKPILKKRSVSEVMLQKSLSSSSLVKEAAAAVQAQRSRKLDSYDRPRLGRTLAETVRRRPKPKRAETLALPSIRSSGKSSGIHSPEAGKGHIRFNDTVEQCIAVDFKGGESDSMVASWLQEEETSSSEDDLVMMKSTPGRRTPISAPVSRRGSFGQESKGIAMLPSTTLKYHHDELYCPGHPDRPLTPELPSGRLSHSVSQDTIRPSDPSTNFLLDDDDDMSWEPSGAFGSPLAPHFSRSEHGSVENLSDSPSGLRRTASGMFMPLDDDEEDPIERDPSMYGRVVNTVNTARDIFSVIYNVGWRS